MDLRESGRGEIWYRIIAFALRCWRNPREIPYSGYFFPDQDARRYRPEVFGFVCRRSSSDTSNVFVPETKLSVISFDVRLSR